MIAAAPPRDSSLGLVRLIFSLATNPAQQVPEELRKHLTDVISEAKDLLSDSKHVSSKTNPEAIELALGMKASKELANSVEQITTFDSISPAIANKVLKGMGGIYPAY